MEEFYGIKIEYTQSDKYKDVFDLIEKQGYFPNNVARSCTGMLKQEPFGKWLVANDLLRPEACLIWMGMRSNESQARSKKYGSLDSDDVFPLSDLSGKYGTKFRHVMLSLPIVNHTEEEVFADLKQRGHKVNELYSKGAARVGCYPCLLARNADWVLAANDPVGREHIKKLIALEDKFIAEGNPRKLIKIHPTRDVRGLLDNKTLLPSTEPDRRAFSFDIIPTSLIDNIIVSKSAAANLPGDWSGGLVQITTKEVSDNFLNIKIVHQNISSIIPNTSAMLKAIAACINNPLPNNAQAPNLIKDLIKLMLWCILGLGNLFNLSLFFISFVVVLFCC